MSHGPGKLQNAVLDYLANQAFPTTFETLRWQLSDVIQSARIPSPDLPNKWNTSVKRAIDGLIKGKRVAVNPRRLMSFDECVAHYPNKTLVGAARQLRLQLLPVLLNWGDAFPRYSEADNEQFHLESLPPDARERLQKTWLRLEPRLIALLSSHALPDRNALFELLTKGKSVFETRNFKCRCSFAEIVRHCNERGILPAPLSTEVQALSGSMLSLAEAGQLKLRSLIHFFAHIPRHRGCLLKDTTVDYLDQKCPNVVRALPGYEPAKFPEPRSRFALYERKAKHSPQLYKLFDQTVFQSFRFLQLA